MESIPLSLSQSQAQARRERNINWSAEEKDVLVSLVEQHKEDIERKGASVTTVRRRNDAWTSVWLKFSSIFPARPTLNAVKLKELYQRLKTAAKKEISDHKKSVKATGGGLGSGEPTQLAQRISELSPVDFKEIYNSFDDDATLTASASPSPPSPRSPSSSPSTSTSGSGVDYLSAHISSLESELRSVKSPYPSKPPSSCSDYTTPRATSRDTYQLKRRCPTIKRPLDSLEDMQRAEHDKRMRHLDEEHAARMAVISLEHQIQETKLKCLKGQQDDAIVVEYV